MTDIFVSEHVQECYIDQDERIEVIIVQAFGREFRAMYPYMLDTPDVIGVDHDGEVYVASCGQRPIADNGAWYMGDEDVLIGVIKLDNPGDWETMCAHIEKVNGVFVEMPWPEDFTPTLVYDDEY
ncbi:hypothetical protein VPHD148_0215 [Vibrio phage D148]